MQVRLHLGGRSVPGSRSGQGEDCAVMRGGGKGGLAGYGAWLSGEHGELVRCAEELEGSGSECAAIGGGNGALGLWAALDAVFPTRSSEVLEPPCAEVQAKLPKALNSEAAA